jgi:hypothetical protein
MFWNSQHDGTVIKAMFQTTNQLYSPIINQYQPILTMINQDYPIWLSCGSWSNLHMNNPSLGRGYPSMCSKWLQMASTQLQVVGKA